MSLKLKIFFCVLSGIILALSMPEPGWWFLAWFGFIPLLIVIWNEREKKSFIYGIITGFIYNSIIIWWITIFGYLPWFLLVLYQSVFWGIFAFISSFLKPQKSGILVYFGIPCVWIIIQWIRTLGTYAFPWGSLAHSQIPNLAFIQISSITGSYGVDFIILLTNLFFSVLFICSKQKKVAFIGLFIIIFAVIVNAIVFNFINNRRFENYIPAKVAMIQRSEETGILATRHEVMNASETYKNLTIKAGELRPDFIVWPETALPVAVTDNGWGSLISNLALYTNTILVAGVIEPYKNDYARNYNSAFVYNNNGDKIGTYRKVKLVPFGEFVPARNKLPFLNKYQIRETDVVAGAEHNIISTDYGDLGILICFESIFPSISREIVSKGADVIFVLTNDSWFKDSFAAKQHMYFSVLRAIETRRSVVRSAATGISALIDPLGNIEKKTEIFKETILYGNTFISKNNDSKTFYVKYGDWFVYLCIFIFILSVFIVLAVSKHFEIYCKQNNNRLK